jgi:hypothetical protein
MKKFLVIFLALVCQPGLSKINIPYCQGSSVTSWTGCFGSVTWEGDSYTGEWVNGKPNGSGVITSEKNRFKFIGNFRDGRPHGIGEYSNEVIRFVGEFIEGEFHGGQATVFFPNGVHYKGRVNRLREPHGWGILSLPDGRKHVGEFSHGRAHGRGVEYLSGEGKSQEGVWDGGRFVRAERIPDEIAGRSPDTKENQSSGQTVLKEPSEQSIRVATERCSDLGFKPKTEKFGDCVLLLIKLNSTIQ